MNGEARVVVGARSSLFLPFPELGLVIVDEEHEQAFKQQDGAIYHARDMAVVRARIEDCPVVLASATPSLESFVNAQSGRYTHLKLVSRHGVAEMPEVRLIDLRHERDAPDVEMKAQWLSPPLRAALEKTLAAGEQAMLFLNRRGYAPLTLCEACGHKFTCPHCSAWLVEHKYKKRLACHQCGYELPMPSDLPAMPRDRHPDRLRSRRGTGGGRIRAVLSQGALMPSPRPTPCMAPPKPRPPSAPWPSARSTC